MVLMKIIKSFHFVSFLSVFIIFLISYFKIIPKEMLFSFKDISIGLIVISMIFSLFFARSKSFVLLFIPLFFSYYMFYPHLLGLNGGEHSFWYIYPIATSISFLFIGILQERGLFCFYGVLKIFIMISILSLVYYFLYYFSIELKNALDTPIISFKVPLIKVNDFTLLISFLSILFVTIISNIFFITNIEKATSWILIALLIPALLIQNESSFILFITLGATLNIGALLKDTYSMAYIDTLTKIPARRALEEAFLKLNSTYSIAMVDIDLFKKFNDTYGHDIGDEVLKLVAEQLSNVKGGGKAFRYGGEEFTILFPNKNSDEILIFLEEVRTSIEKRAFIIRGKDRPKKEPEKKIKSKDLKSVNVTVSIGVAHAPYHGKTTQEIMKKADIALYKAKKSGRNCTIKL